MRDNGFPVTTGRSGWLATVKDVLGDRRGAVHTARRTDQVEAVVKTMQEHDVSQMPVVDERALHRDHPRVRPPGFLIEGKHRLSEVVEPLVQPLQGVVGPRPRWPASATSSTTTTWRWCGMATG